MSLRVWLPLTKDLRNQGLDDVTVTNNGATFDVNGKLGGCYSFDGSTSSINTNINIPNFALDKTYSITCWVCPSGTSGQKPIIGIGSDWSWTIFQQDTDLRFVQWDESSFRWGDPAISGVFSANTWVHIGVVWNQGILLFYKNGEKIYEWTAPTSRTIKVSSDTVKIGGNIYAWGNNYFNGKLNDVRIYDHALSPLEIKHISQGLVLHYPLNRGGWGNENLLKNTNVSVTNGYKTGFVLSQTIPSGTKVTFSLQVDAINLVLSGNKRIGLEGYQNNGTNNSYKGVWTNAQGTYSKRIFATVTLDRDFLINNNTFGIYIQTVSSGSVTISNPKIEIGEIATPWCPNSADELATSMGLNDNVEYDTSGYGNNGTRTGTFSWTGDTPRYQISTYFADGSTSYITASVFMPTDKITTSVWFKGDGSTSGANSYHIPFCLGSGKAEFSVNNAKLYRQGYYINGTRYCDTISGAIVNDGQWHMMTATYDGTTLCRYLDGQLIDSKSISGTLNGGMLTLLIGKYYQGGYNNKKVKQSDVRIYATALSAEDIKDLYNLGASIDSNNNLLTYELNEE